jgi:hypothetical protein
MSVEVNDSGKHSSLLPYHNHYGRKKSYRTGPLFSKQNKCEVEGLEVNVKPGIVANLVPVVQNFFSFSPMSKTGKLERFLSSAPIAPLHGKAPFLTCK